MSAPAWILEAGGVELECEECHARQLMPLIESEGHPAISIVEADGWETYPRQLCPRHAGPASTEEEQCGVDREGGFR